MLHRSIMGGQCVPGHAETVHLNARNSMENGYFLEENAA